MISILTWEQGLIASLLAINGASLAAAAWSFRRLRLPRGESTGSATLVMAVTGKAPRLERLLRALERQTLKPRRLILAIESVADPAFQVAERLTCSQTDFPLEIVIAGQAERSAQKCLNLIAAYRRIDSEDEIIVMLDADILPPPWWLSALVTPLMRGHCDIVTGYRWPMIERQTLGAHLIVAIDRTVALLPRPRWGRAVWGGTLAVHRRAFDILDLEHEFGRTLSDDLTVGTLAAERGLRVLSRGALLVPTPLALDFRSAWQFGRRQYQIIRIYRPQIWMLALLTMSVQQAGWTAVLTRLDISGSALVILLVLALAKQLLLDAAGRRLGHAEVLPARLCQLALACAKPLIDTFHLSMIIASARSRLLSWSHVTYRIESPSGIAIQERRSWNDSAF